MIYLNAYINSVVFPMDTDSVISLGVVIVPHLAFGQVWYFFKLVWYFPTQRKYNCGAIYKVRSIHSTIIKSSWKSTE